MLFLMRFASTGENVETGKSAPDPPLRLEDKKPEEDKDPGDIV
jgi:hypothetical protein